MFDVITKRGREDKFELELTKATIFTVLLSSSEAMAATHRHEEELKQKCKQKAQTEKDPLELLRLKCLERGAAGIKGIGRYVVLIPVSIPLLWWVPVYVQSGFNSTTIQRKSKLSS